MKGQNLAVTILLAASAVLFSSGVYKKMSGSGGESDSLGIIAVIPKGTASMWWEVVRQGAQAAADERGYSIIWVGPEQETDREKQIQVVEDAISKGVSAIVLGPNDAQALARPVENIKRAGIPCVIIDSGVETDVYDAFAATDNYAGGAAAARRLGAALNGRGDVVLTQFVQNSSSTEQRALGFKETLAKEFAGITLVGEQYTLGTVEDARQKTVDMLTRYPKARGIFAVNHPTSVGAYKALQSQGLSGKIKYVGFDSDPILVQGIEQGDVEALIVQNPFEIGYQGVAIAARILAGETPEKLQPVASMIADRTNIAELKIKHPSALGL